MYVLLTGHIKNEHLSNVNQFSITTIISNKYGG